MEENKYRMTTKDLYLLSLSPAAFIKDWVSSEENIDSIYTTLKREATKMSEVFEDQEEKFRNSEPMLEIQWE